MKNGVKTALIQTPVWGIYEPPFALSLLSALLKQSQNKVRAFDFNIDLYKKRSRKYNNAWAIEQSFLWSDKDFAKFFFEDNIGEIEKHINLVLEFEPDAAGFTVNHSSKLSCLKYASLLKKKKPELKIIFGGHMFMLFKQQEIDTLFNSGYVDYIVYGEGDVTFLELLRRMTKGRGYDLCKSIYYLNNGEVIKTPPRPLLKNLDILPFLDFSDLPLDNYNRPHWLGNHLTLQASRGCPWKCVFCGATSFWKEYRCMSGRRLYQEIWFHLENYPGIEHIEFMDLLFNGNMRALEEFCDLMIENSPKPGLVWHANAVIRPEMTPEILKKMKKAGCLRLTYGIESGSQRVLKLMKKNYRITDARKVFKATAEAGILIKANFMFGFPGETEEDFQKTLGFLRDNAEYINVAYPSFSFCVPESNSYLGQHMEEFGIVQNSADNLYWESVDRTNTYPERMRRWEEFSAFARKLGVDIGIGLDTSLKQHRWFNLGYYYKSIGKRRKALESFLNYLEFDQENKAVREEIRILKESLS